MQNPLDKKDKINYTIIPNDTQLAKDWIAALEQDVLQKRKFSQKRWKNDAYTTHLLGGESLNGSLKALDISDKISPVLCFLQPRKGHFCTRYGFSRTI